MIRVLWQVVFGGCMIAVLAGCSSLESTRSAGGFVGAIDSSQFDTFYYKETQLAGSPFREAQQKELQVLSPQVVDATLSALGYAEGAQNGDFYVVVRWSKGISSYAGLFDSVDGPSATINRRSNAKSSVTVRVTITVEMYEAATDQVFWRAELPGIFDAIQYKEQRVVQSLERALQKFPARLDAHVK